MKIKGDFDEVWNSPLTSIPFVDHCSMFDSPHIHTMQSIMVLRKDMLTERQCQLKERRFVLILNILTYLHRPISCWPEMSFD